jgi:hypothetical protein
MAHYAFIDENNIVVEVITGRNEDEIVDGISDWEKYYEQLRPELKCLRTSYNGNIRGIYAGIGMTYDPIRDAFIPPMPPTTIEDPENENGTKEVIWILNEDTCLWEESNI